MEYNGWANYETWNVALWIQNDEGMYNLARDIVKHRYLRPYASFVENMNDFGITQTPDGVLYNDRNLDIDELDNMMQEIA